MEYIKMILVLNCMKGKLIGLVFFSYKGDILGNVACGL